MHNGFYLELDGLKEDDDDASFGFLENIGSEYNIRSDGFLITAYDYLHGYCDLFAYALHERYGLPLYEIRDDKNDLVHCFAIAETSSGKMFVDVRGATTDYFEFIEDFEDFIEDVTDFSVYRIDPIDSQSLFFSVAIPDEDHKAFLDHFFSDYDNYYSFAKPDHDIEVEEDQFLSY